MTAAAQVNLTLMVHISTDGAWKVSPDNKFHDSAVWLPKSQCDDGGLAEVGKWCDFSVPVWLAEKKELV